MSIIYVYKFNKDDKLDVFEADTFPASPKEDGSFLPTRMWGSEPKTFRIEYKKCIINGSSKGITQYNKKCDWIIVDPGVIYRNKMWLPEYNITKAIEIFKKYNDDKIFEYTKLIHELEESNKNIDMFASYCCTHKYPDNSLALEVSTDNQIKCKICGKSFSAFQANLLNNENKNF